MASLLFVATACASAASANRTALDRFLARHSTVVHFPKGPSAEFHLFAPGGYRIQVSAIGRFVSLGVSKGQAFTDYSTRGVVSSRRIEAHFADLGDISVRFRASGKASRVTLPSPPCRTATRFTSRLGQFSGEIRFSGENDYLALDAQRAKGAVVNQTTVKCRHAKAPHHHRSVHHHRHPEPKTPALLATGHSSQRGAAKFFSIEAAPEPNGKDIAFALVSEKHAAVNVDHMAIGFFATSSFTFDTTLSSAQVSLPAPFSGSATFQRNPDGSTSWTGSLAASFPGAESVPLTGSEWTAQLALGRSQGAGWVVVISHP